MSVHLFLEMNTCVQQGHIQLIKIVIKKIFISNKVCKFQLYPHPIKKMFRGLHKNI